VRAYLRTFGCRANHYDTEQVRAKLVASGWAIVDQPAEADVAIFNSCTVTAAAESDLRSAVRRTASRVPGVQTLVMGCAAAVDDGTLASLPSVRAVVPRAEWADVAAALGLDVRSDAGGTATGQTPTRALLRVQDGCDEHCTFCLTRVARGAQRSRAIDALVDEAAALAAHHAEIVITGTHIGSYGADIGTSLGALVERLVRELPGVRFRLSSIEATEVDDRLRALLRDAPMHLAPFLHAPLQSGSDRVLRRMGRHWYTPAQYAEAIECIVRDRPVFGLAADVIAGFPGETEDDHAATMRLIDRLPFTALHVFPYSARPGTPAVRLDGAVPSATIARRARELRELAAAKGAAYRARRAGQPADVVVTGSAARREGVTGDYLIYPVDAALPRGSRFTGVVPA
jgi:threonylcarbamoyladenosine tRNA methylthiotransferase MtaB